MTISTLANIAQALAVVVALVFGVVQVRNARERRRGEAMFSLVHSLQTRDMLAALLTLDEIPPGLSKGELGARLGERFIDLQVLLGTWESLGIMVFHGEVDLSIVDDFYSGSIIHSWMKLKTMVEEVRAESSRDTRWEWFQWLAEQMLAREFLTPPEPAYRAHREWVAR
jgi:hypothetical protein